MIGETDEDLCLVQIVQGLEDGDYLAWPDEGCRKGAPTTTEFVVYDEGEEVVDDPKMTEDVQMDESLEVETDYSTDEAGEMAVVESSIEGETTDGEEGA
jgi:hypothetical protein